MWVTSQMVPRLREPQQAAALVMDMFGKIQMDMCTYQRKKGLRVVERLPQLHGYAHQIGLI
jgi:hypothetical protein